MLAQKATAAYNKVQSDSCQDVTQDTPVHCHPSKLGSQCEYNTPGGFKLTSSNFTDGSGTKISVTPSTNDTDPPRTAALMLPEGTEQGNYALTNIYECSLSCINLVWGAQTSAPQIFLKPTDFFLHRKWFPLGLLCSMIFA